MLFSHDYESELRVVLAVSSDTARAMGPFLYGIYIRIPFRRIYPMLSGGDPSLLPRLISSASRRSNVTTTFMDAMRSSLTVITDRTTMISFHLYSSRRKTQSSLNPYLTIVSNYHIPNRRPTI